MTMLQTPESPTSASAGSDVRLEMNPSSDLYASFGVESPRRKSGGRRASLSAAPYDMGVRQTSTLRKKKNRRASMSGPVVDYVGNDYGYGADQDNFSAHSGQQKNHMLNIPPSDGYGTDDEEKSMHSQRSMRRRASMTRRKSAGFGCTPKHRTQNSGMYGPARPEHDGPNYRHGSNEQYEQYENPRSRRCMSDDGDFSRRRPSYGDGGYEPGTPGSRRGVMRHDTTDSISLNPDRQGASNARRGRRGSCGPGYDVNQPPKFRRSSSGGRRRHGADDIGLEGSDYDSGQMHLDHGQRRHMSGYSDYEPTTPGSRRGVLRHDTTDSITYNPDQQGSRNVRRNRRGSCGPGYDVNQVPGCHRMKYNDEYSHRRPSYGDGDYEPGTPGSRRGVMRHDTTDSITLNPDRQGAGNARRGCRGSCGPGYDVNQPPTFRRSSSGGRRRHGAEEVGLEGYDYDSGQMHPDQGQRRHRSGYSDYEPTTPGSRRGVFRHDTSDSITFNMERSGSVSGGHPSPQDSHKDRPSSPPTHQPPILSKESRMFRRAASAGEAPQPFLKSGVLSATENRMGKRASISNLPEHTSQGCSPRMRRRASASGALGLVDGRPRPPTPPKSPTRMSRRNLMVGMDEPPPNGSPKTPSKSSRRHSLTGVEATAQPSSSTPPKSPSQASRQLFISSEDRNQTQEQPAYSTGIVLGQNGYANEYEYEYDHDHVYEEDEDEDGTDYGYGDQNHTNAYGYGIQNSMPHLTSSSKGRRESHVSQMSTVGRRGSTMSRSRCGSSHSRKDRNPKTVADLMAGPRGVPDNDTDDDSTVMGPKPSSSMYGYGDRQPSLQYDSGVESDSDRTHSSMGSMSSAKRTRRRNSCLIRPEQDAAIRASLLDDTPRMSDRDLLAQVEEDEEELDDPDSLLSRAMKQTNSQKAERPLIPDIPDDEPNLLASPGKGSKKSFNGLTASPKKALSSKGSWPRATPFTTSHGTLTEERLSKSPVNPYGQGGDGLMKYNSMHANWGDLDLESDDPSSSESDYGAKMYDESPAMEEIDKYKQKARRSGSIKKGCVDMQIILGSEDTGAQIPNFKPATGCTNASDFIVRCFSGRLRQGITVLKHNRSRWSKSSLRQLFLLPDGKTLIWKPLEGQQDKGRRPKLDLTKCLEVRHAWQKDPDTRKHTGTATLRKRCKDGIASRSFALIFKKRTLDLTALSNDQCKVMMEGFSALCFRLQLERLEDESVSQSKQNEASSMFEDGEWESTVYGSTIYSTASPTQTNTTPPKDEPQIISVASWGL